MIPTYCLIYVYILLLHNHFACHMFLAAPSNVIVIRNANEKLVQHYDMLRVYLQKENRK